MNELRAQYSLLAATKFNGGGRAPAEPLNIEQIFGENTFGLEQMKSRLPRNVYRSLLATIEKGEPLDSGIADAVAMAMKEWAVEKGATHFTHWFQPLTGYTAEKHDSFITPNKGGGAVAEFSGKDLIQGEPDASSFPSGGIRATFEARGYTAWDPTSPAFIIENPNGKYLAIPTGFASWSGEALDHKIPLLRSMAALDKQARRALALFGQTDVEQVFPTVGSEQEYFLVDEEFFYRRPDLDTCGRTLFGLKPPRGQELGDHYFGSIPDRILAYMLDVERELYRLGIPVKTRHNEVAPGQYEIAPLFENANLAADHQQLVMLTLRRVARRYGLVCLLHEKPFRGVNGSGKHNNWSMSTNTGLNLLDPGETPHENIQFLFFCIAVIRAVHRHQDLMRIAVSTAGNDHRLGGHEAPPAIMSVFLGDQLTDILMQLASGGATASKKHGLLGLGVKTLPAVPRHAGDRNRTSPLAFTGNKFEFRAVGASQSVSFATVVMNLIVTEALDEMTTMLEDRLTARTKKKDFERAVGEVLREVLAGCEQIVFEGDGYSVDWHEEAASRGLLNLPTTLDALEMLPSEKNIELFEKYDVLTEREVRSRHEIGLEQYFFTINIEAETTESIARTMILPSAVRYLHELVQTIEDGEDVGIDCTAARETAEEVATHLNKLRAAIRELVMHNKELGGDDVYSKSVHMRDNVRPAMDQVRHWADRLERMIPHDYWPLPTYREILFVK